MTDAENWINRWSAEHERSVASLLALELPRNLTERSGWCAELRDHIWFEETVLFRELRPWVDEVTIDIMEMEHGDLWRKVDQAKEEVIRHGHLGPGRGIEIANMLAAHNHKEEVLIYRNYMRLRKSDRLGSLFAPAGPKPSQWTCKHAVDVRRT